MYCIRDIFTYKYIFHPKIICWISCTTFLQNSIPLCPINLLSANDVAGGVGEVNEFACGVKVQSSGVHQILDGDHVLVRHLGVHVHAPDDAWAAFTVDQEELVLGFCSKTGQRGLNSETSSSQNSCKKCKLNKIPKGKQSVF